jgi:asparagine N-glycosylation enzyme membrane subunit Stt3
MAVSLLLFYLPFYMKNGLPRAAAPENLLQAFISDFGGMAGFSAFTLLLAAFGLVIVWRVKKVHTASFFAAALILFYFFFSYATVYSNFAAAVAAGVAFSRLASMRWQLKVIRDISLLILLCGTIFSAVSYSLRIGNAQPYPEMADSLEWVKENSGADDAVFSFESNGFWIERYAQRKVLMDGLFEYAPYYEEYLNDSLILFNTLDIRETRKMIEKHGIKFILITDQMRNGAVWQKPDQGLLLLLKNRETFKEAYTTRGIEIYEYIYRGE